MTVGLPNPLSGSQVVNAVSGGAKSFAGQILIQGTINWQTSNELQLSGVGTTLRNEGLLRKSAGSGVSHFETALVNTGIIEVLSGTIELPANWVNNGELRGTATLRSTALTNLGRIAPGRPDERIATLALQGNLVQGALGWLEFDLGTAGMVDLLNVSGSVSFGGSVSFEAIYGASYLDLRVSAVPEPAAGWLMGAGLAFLGWRAGQRRQGR